MHSADALPQAEMDTWKRKCAQLSASPLTCRPFQETSGSISAERLAALMLHLRTPGGFPVFRTMTQRRAETNERDARTYRPRGMRVLYQNQQTCGRRRSASPARPRSSIAPADGSGVETGPPPTIIASPSMSTAEASNSTLPSYIARNSTQP